MFFMYCFYFVYFFVFLFCFAIYILLLQNTMLQTLLTMQVSLCYFILTLLTIRVTYAGNTILNTVTGKKKRQKIKSYKRNLYMVLKFVRLLLRTAISRCILIFSLRSVRKQSKQSFFSCKQLLYMKYFAIRSE